jgi:MFS family permease
MKDANSSIKQGILVTIIVSGSMILNIMNVQGSLLALPTIAKDLNIKFINYQWIISAYSLSFGSFLLLFGRLSDL